MTTVQITDVEFDFEDDFGVLEIQQQEQVKSNINGMIFHVEESPENEWEFEYAICEEITSETGWMVKSFQYNIIQTKM